MSSRHPHPSLPRRREEGEGRKERRDACNALGEPLPRLRGRSGGGATNSVPFSSFCLRLQASVRSSEIARAVWRRLATPAVAPGHDSGAAPWAHEVLGPPSDAADGRLTPVATPAAARSLDRAGLFDRITPIGGGYVSLRSRVTGIPSGPGNRLTCRPKGDRLPSVQGDR